MARPEKIGLEYFSMDTDFMDQPVTKMVIAEYREKGYVIMIQLLCYIYAHKGYYMVWDDQTKLLFANSVTWCGASANLCEQVVHFLVKWDFFDKNLFNSDKVLTNKRCQKNFLSAGRKRINRFINNRYDLITNKGAEETEFSAEETQKKAEESTQRKGKEIKVESVTPKNEFTAEETLGIAHWKIISKQSYADCNEEFRKRYSEKTFIAYKKFNEWLDNEYSFIRERTQQQITISDFQKLQKKFSTEQIMSGIGKVASSNLNADHNLYARLVHFIEKPFGTTGTPIQKPVTASKTTTNDLSKKDIYAS